jgi:hypothetical protein
MASTYLTKTFSSSGSQQTVTFSVWVKRSGLGGGGDSLFGYKVDANNFLDVRFGSSDNLLFRNYNGGTYTWRFDTNRKFRDTNAWYHLVFSADSTQATEANRFKLYVNGVQETSFSTSTYPSQNANLKWGNSSYAHLVGDTTGGDDFDGVMTHIHVIDGTAYDADTFGETDSTTGIWKPKTAPSVTYGTNGFFLKFASSGSMGTDSSGNANTFTVSGNLTQTQDTPSNIFATLNALYKTVACTLSNGNTRSQITSTTSKYAPGSTLKVSSGKWYAEFKCNSNGGAEQQGVGLYGDEQNASSNDQGVGKANDSYSWRSDGEFLVDNTGSPDFNSYGSGDIISIALDLDNNYLYFAKNGVWENSGDPTSGATGTGGKSITAASGTVDGVYSMGAGSNSSGYLSDWSANFGNGYFGTTAVSSAQSPSDGIGLFEYDVPSGYKALCTKSINSQEYS